MSQPNRHSFCRFLGRDLEDKVPDAKTIWLFREQLRVEHVFGSMTNEQGGLYCRVIGLARTATKIGLMNLVYIMRRLVQIDRLHASGV